MFVPLLAGILQALCVHCCRLRLSPWYVLVHLPLTAAVQRSAMRQLRRLKDIATLCARQSQCQFCGAGLLTFKQYGIAIVARPASAMPAATTTAVLGADVVERPAVDQVSPTTTAPPPPALGPTTTAPGVLVPALSVFAILTRVPDLDLLTAGNTCTHTHTHTNCGSLCLSAMGFGPLQQPAAAPSSSQQQQPATNHPCNAVMVSLPVMPPVSRPSMRSLSPHGAAPPQPTPAPCGRANLKTGQPFVVEDSITAARSPSPSRPCMGRGGRPWLPPNTRRC